MFSFETETWPPVKGAYLGLEKDDPSRVPALLSELLREVPEEATAHRKQFLEDARQAFRQMKPKELAQALQAGEDLLPGEPPESPVGQVMEALEGALREKVESLVAERKPCMNGGRVGRDTAERVAAGFPFVVALDIAAGGSV
jgi:hypothetical protein